MNFSILFSFHWEGVSKSLCGASLLTYRGEVVWNQSSGFKNSLTFPMSSWSLLGNMVLNYELRKKKPKPNKTIMKCWKICWYKKERYNFDQIMTDSVLKIHIWIMMHIPKGPCYTLTSGWYNLWTFVNNYVTWENVLVHCSRVELDYFWSSFSSQINLLLWKF